MTDLPTLEAALKLADQDSPLPSLAGPALKVLRSALLEHLPPIHRPSDTSMEELVAKGRIRPIRLNDIDGMQWPFQYRVGMWMEKCFGEVEALAADVTNPIERNHRFLEESIELVQACGCTASEAHQLVDYVFGRPIGEKSQEVGGVMVTLAALCQAQGLDMRVEGETELARIWTKIEKIRAKHAAKPKHSPLPGSSPIYGMDHGTGDKTMEAFGHMDGDGKMHFEQLLESEPNSPNSGHGHVRTRPDGMVAKCGGPMLCHVCFKELADMLEIPGGECWCDTCRPVTATAMRMVLCPTCGNKRCPHAHDHRNACTGSNAVGQPGSSWEHVKPITPADSGESSC